MRRSHVFLVLFLSVASLTSAGEPVEVSSRIRSVGLFKNGLAVVRRDIAVASDGNYTVLDVPAPVHGTFWIESDAKVDTRVTRRTITVRNRSSPAGDLQRSLAGKDITVTLRGEPLPISGHVVEFPEPTREWSHQFGSFDRWGNPVTHLQPESTSTKSRFLVLETSNGDVFIDRLQISRLEVGTIDVGRTIEQPVLMFSTTDVPEGGGTIRISYLTKGLAWAPSYQLDLGEGTMSIEQQALIRNELADLEDAEIELISGFPSIEFAHVTSPLSPRTDWSQFFSQLNQHLGAQHALASNITSQGVAYNNNVFPAGADEIVPSVDGVDAHYQPVGRRSLDRGDTLILSVARSETSYERIVEWVVSDNRDKFGRYVDKWQPQQNGDHSGESAWDSVQFSNPFDFPMTTAPASVVSDGRFRGQRMSRWVNVGQATSLPITKALSIRTLASEREEPNTRDHKTIGGRVYRHVNVGAELLVCNHRNETVKMVVRRQFSGQLLEADADPKERLLDEGAFSINQRNELTWVVEVEPGTERTLTYRYEVLVRR